MWKRPLNTRENEREDPPEGVDVLVETKDGRYVGARKVGDVWYFAWSGDILTSCVKRWMHIPK